MPNANPKTERGATQALALKLYGDYHTHTKYSDAGHGITVADNVKSAISAGLQEIAITDHGFNNPILALTRRKFRKEKIEVEEARKTFPQIKIYHGIEADIISLDGRLDITEEEIEDVDLLVAGFHAGAIPPNGKSFRRMYMPVFKKAVFPRYSEHSSIIADNTKAYIKCIEKYPIDVLAHPDNRLRINAYDVCKCCADNGTIVEINAKHVDIVERTFDDMLRSNALLMANTDSHRPNRIGDFTAIADFFASRGINSDILCNKNGTPPFKRGGLNRVKTATTGTAPAGNVGATPCRPKEEH